MDTITIDCDECTLVGTDACGGCVVSALIGPPTGNPLSFDPAEQRAVQILGGCGLVPPLRHCRRPVRA